MDVAADQSETVADLQTHHIRQAFADQGRVLVVRREEAAGRNVRGDQADRRFGFGLDADNAHGEGALVIGGQAAGGNAACGGDHVRVRPGPLCTTAVSFARGRSGLVSIFSR